MTENQIREEVLKYLKSKIGQQLNIFNAPNFLQEGWSFKKEYPIQFGSKRGYADLALLRNNKPFVIFECKRPGVSQTVISEGKEQLKSYLNASGTMLGIFANNPDPDKWRYYDNSIGFNEISRSIFWEKVRSSFAIELDIETQAQRLKQQRIEARANQLVTPEAVQTCADRMIDEQAKMRITENEIQGAVAQQLQERINYICIELENSKSSAAWGWILFGISILFFIFSHSL